MSSRGPSIVFKSGKDHEKVSLDYAKRQVAKYLAEELSVKLEELLNMITSSGFTLEQVGTTLPQLLGKRSFRISRAKKEAEVWVTALRRGDSSTPDLDIEFINKIMTKYHFTLSDLGTSEEELALLRKQSFFNMAKRRLKYLREGIAKNDTFLYQEQFNWVLNSCAKAGVTLAEIGTTSQEIAELWTSYSNLRAQGILKDIRKNNWILSNSEGAVRIRKLAEEGNFELFEIGTNDIELDMLSRYVKYY